MDPLTPKFTGSSKEDVENWLFKIEQSFNKALIGYTDRLVETIPFVGDYPFDLLRKHIMEHRSWKDYETTLRKTFSKAHKSEKFRTELINLKHKDNATIEVYNMKFLKLTFHLESMSVEDKLFYYMNGLKD